VEVARVLIEKGADVNYEYGDDVPLIWLLLIHNASSTSSFDELVQLLMVNGAKPDIDTIQLAIEKGLVDVVRIMGGSQEMIEDAEKQSEPSSDPNRQMMMDAKKAEEEMTIPPAKEKKKSQTDTMVLERSLLRSDDTEMFRFGIELETCVSAYEYEDTKHIIAAHFEETNDGSIRCAEPEDDDNPLRPIEFVYDGTFKLSDLDTKSVQDAFHQISRISYTRVRTNHAARIFTCRTYGRVFACTRTSASTYRPSG
jgi:hypothetical protein